MGPSATRSASSTARWLRPASPSYTSVSSQPGSLVPLTGRLADELRAPPRSDGIVVNQLHRESAAFQAGLAPGDIILSFNGAAVTDPSQFVRMVADSAIGATARVEVLREGRRQTIRIPITQQERRVRRR